MKIDLKAQIVFKLPLTTKHVSLLIRLSEHHYDGKCRKAKDGFLKDWDAIIKSWDKFPPDPEYRYVEASSHEIDTCLKLMEIARGFFNVDDWLICCSLGHSFSGAMSLANQCYSNWKATWE